MSKKAPYKININISLKYILHLKLYFIAFSLWLCCESNNLCSVQVYIFGIKSNSLFRRDCVEALSTNITGDICRIVRCRTVVRISICSLRYVSQYCGWAICCLCIVHLWRIKFPVYPKYIPFDTALLISLTDAQQKSDLIVNVCPSLKYYLYPSKSLGHFSLLRLLWLGLI